MSQELKKNRDQMNDLQQTIEKEIQSSQAKMMRILESDA